MKQKILIITDSDLDGAGSALILKWILPKSYDICIFNTTVTKFRNEILEWLKFNTFDNYDIVFICDLDVSSSIDLVDKQNVFIIDHHESHKNLYKNCKTNIQISTSTVILIYNLFLKNKKLSENELNLIKLIDDYDSFKLKYKQSTYLNIIFWTFSGNKVLKFIEKYEKGFIGFNKFDINTINNYNKKLEKIINSLEIFNGKIKFNNCEYNCFSTIADFGINDICNYLKTFPNCDICFVVNTKSMIVSFRKNDNCELNLSDFAKYIGNGGGHSNAAGCPLTDDFIKLLQTFNLYVKNGK